MPTPYPFVSGATLLASQMNSLSQLPTVSITANSTAVATHAYSRVIANGSAITYTIPNSVFEAGQVIEFHNINSTNCTIAAGAGVTLNAAAGTTVAQYQSATIYATSASSFILFESDRTVSAGGLVYLTGTSVSAVSSFSLPDSTFTSTYRNYRVVVEGVGANDGNAVTMRLRASGSDNTTSNYFSAVGGANLGATFSGAASSGGTSWTLAGSSNTKNYYVFDVLAPQVAVNTAFGGTANAAISGNMTFTAIGGFFSATTAFDSLSIIIASPGTFTGTYRVYGYADS